MRVPTFPGYPKKMHKASGQARIRIKNHDHYLGAFGSQESRLEYARLATLHATGATLAKRPESITISSMISAWHADAEKWSAKRELVELERAAMVLDRLYGPTPAAEFDVTHLATVRESMISGSWLTDAERGDYLRRRLPIGWCKNQVNHMLGRVKRIFRFAENHKLVSKGTWDHLRSLRPLRKREVRETSNRKPVEESVVTATLPHLSLMVASMVRVQLHTGMRPSEICAMCADHFEQGPEGCWLYRLDEYKSGHMEDADEWQFVVMGPECQREISRWLEHARALGGDVFLWRPSARRSAPYTVNGYYQAVIDGAKSAGVEKWYPYLLRHTCKRRIVRAHGSDAARAILRQRTLDATEKYAAQQDVATAAKIQAKAG